MPNRVSVITARDQDRVELERAGSVQGRARPDPAGSPDHPAAQTHVNTNGWTQLTGTATVSWTGTLTNASFYVETAAGTDNLYVDDASFQ